MRILNLGYMSFEVLMLKLLLCLLKYLEVLEQILICFFICFL